MIRLILSDEGARPRSRVFAENAVTIGRSPANVLCLSDPGVSKHHGRIYATHAGYVYEDLDSTNGSEIIHGQERIPLVGQGTKAVAIAPGDVISIPPYSLELEAATSELIDTAGAGEVTIMLANPCRDAAGKQDELRGTDLRQVGQFLSFVHETQGLLTDENALLDAVNKAVFRIFPQSTYLILAVREGGDDRLRPLLMRSREGAQAALPLSRTIAEQVMTEQVALMYTQGMGGISATDSIMAAKIQYAICAPLCGQSEVFGILQLDIRDARTLAFSQSDLELLVLLANYIGLALDNMRLYQEQRRALQSMIDALVHSLSLKDPDTAHHSERVRAIATMLGEEMALGADELEVLGVAAALHDTGKHASPLELLQKPGRLTPEERCEIDEHVSHTQGVLDRIHYPAHLKDVPRIAAYHHEKMDGSGTYGISGEEIPLLSRIIAVADVLDALVAPRTYKPAMSIPGVLATLEQDRDVLWDGAVLDVVQRLVPEIARSVYGLDSVVIRPPGTADATLRDEVA